MSTCVFCDIAVGLGPAKIVQRCNRHDTIALVPLSPVVDGHVLFIPREHVADLANDPIITGQVMECAAQYAGRYPSANVLTSMGRPATQTVFHLHVHVVPRTETDGLMLPWGTIYGTNPADPHWCHVAERLREALLEVQAVQKELNASGNPILQSAAGRLNGIKAHLWTPEELAALETDR